VLGIFISDSEKEGGVLHPAFYGEGGVGERDGFYIAKYRAAYNEKGDVVSQKGLTPILCTRDESRRFSENAVFGGHTMTFWEYNAVALLAMFCGYNLDGDKSKFTPINTTIKGSASQGQRRQLELQQICTGFDSWPKLPKSEFSTAKTGEYSVALSSSVALADLGHGFSEHLYFCFLPVYADIIKVPSFDYQSEVGTSSNCEYTGAAVNGGGVSLRGILDSKNAVHFEIPLFMANPQNKILRLSKASFYTGKPSGGVVTVGGSLPYVSINALNGNPDMPTGWNVNSEGMYDNALNIVVPDDDKACFRFCTYEL